MSEASQPLNALPQGYRLQEYELVRVLGFSGLARFDYNLDLSPKWSATHIREGGTGNR